MLGKSHGLRSLVGYSPWGRKESDRTGRPHFHHTVALTSHASKVMLKILQARLQQYVNRELPDVQTGFRKGRGTRDQTDNIRLQRKHRNPRTTATSASLSEVTQSCPTLCNPINCSLPGSSIHGIFQARILEWVAYQAPPSMGFSRQEYWSGLPFPSLGDLPNPETEPRFPAL